MSKRLLLALGDVSAAEEYVTQLTRKEFTVDVVYDGDAALEYLRASTEPPDGILLDADLPSKNGFAVFEEMKAGLVPPRTPVIFLSAIGKANDLERCNALGAARCIVMLSSTPGGVAAEVEEVLSGIGHPLDAGSVPRSEIDSSEAIPTSQSIEEADALLDDET